MSKKTNRREALSTMGKYGIGGFLSQHPMKILFTALLQGHSQKAFSQALGTNPRNFLSIRLDGAPPRWNWSPLNPFDDDSSVVANSQVGTRYTSSGSKFTGVEYVTTPINGVNMPWMWQYNLPKAGGGVRPMSDLMDSMLVINGTTTNNPAHTGAQKLQNYPLGINYSLSSLTSDGSSAPIPFINMNGSTTGFNSAKGLALVNLPAGGGNLLETLLNPFIVNPTLDFTNNKNSLDNMLNSVMTDLNTIAKAEHISSETIINGQTSAEELIKSGFSDIANYYPTSLGKYQSLIRIAANPDPQVMPLPGLNDQPIGLTGDVRVDIEAVKNIQRMAEQFAVVEYVMTNNLCSSMTIAPRVFNSFVFDEHDTDHLTSLALSTFWNRALAACLLELIDQLKAKGIYQDTIINIAGEFGRNPRNNGTGSDHSPEATSNTFLGGALAGNQFIGNTLKNSTHATYSGTWGYYASNPALSTGGAPVGYLNLGHLAASIATMLRAPSPVTASTTLLKETNGVISSLLPGSKLV